MAITSNGRGGSPFNRTAQHDAKRSAILSQAARLFNSRGSRGTTLLDIAQSLGLTKTSLYYYVKTKEELIYQCYMASLDQHHRNYDEIDQLDIPPLERLAEVLRRSLNDWREAQEGKRNHSAALLEIASLKDQHRENVERRYIQMFKRHRQYLRDGIADGSIRQCETTAVTLALMGSMEWAFNWLRHLDASELDGIVDDACDLLLNGLCTEAGGYSFNTQNFNSAVLETPHGFDRQEQNRLKQEAFFKTGTWFFNKKGFNGTSLDEIAEQLHVTKGAFYYHIKNKEDLLYNCYVRSQKITGSIQAEAEKQATGIARIEYACHQRFYVQNSEQGPLIRYNSITSLPVERRRKILKQTEEYNHHFGQFIRDGIADGTVRNVNVLVAQEMMVGAFNASMDMAQWRDIDDVDQASIDYYDVFFNGLRPRPHGTPE